MNLLLTHNALRELMIHASNKAGDADDLRAKRIESITILEFAALMERVRSAVDHMGYPCGECGMVIMQVHPLNGTACDACKSIEDDPDVNAEHERAHMPGAL